MKKKILFLLSVMIVLTIAACNNDGKGNASNDSANAAIDDNAAPKNNASAQDYSDMADTIRITSEAGNYLDPTIGDRKEKMDTAK